MGGVVKATYKIVPGTDTESEGGFELKYIGKGSAYVSLYCCYGCYPRD